MVRYYARVDSLIKTLPTHDDSLRWLMFAVSVAYVLPLPVYAPLNPSHSCSSSSILNAQTAHRGTAEALILCLRSLMHHASLSHLASAYTPQTTSYGAENFEN